MKEVLDNERNNLIELLDKLSCVERTLVGTDDTLPIPSGDSECKCLLDDVKCNFEITTALIKIVDTIGLALRGGK